jgi:hypothetical protein
MHFMSFCKMNNIENNLAGLIFISFLNECVRSRMRRNAVKMRVFEWL